MSKGKIRIVTNSRMPVSACIYLVLLLINIITAAPVWAGAVEDYATLKQAGYLLVDEHGNDVAASRADEPLIPASTVKLITAWLCLQHWGEQHRFQTGFHFDPVTRVLWVKAGGDPFLVSEEIAVIAAKLVSLGLPAVTAIGLDTGIFEPDLKAPGATVTSNPYDAVPTAIAANFNTVNVRRTNGVVISAEPQTPLTPVSQQIGLTKLEDSASRINTGQSSKVAEQYFAELLGAFLQDNGLEVGDRTLWGTIPAGAHVVLVHSNSTTLGEVVQGMLKYSTNFIANQLILALVAERTQKPANFAAVNRFLDATLSAGFDWRNFKLMEGAGLSRENRLSPRQLVQLLQKFQRWQHLLPTIKPGIVAKTGTLADVKTLVGYITDNKNKTKLFAVLLNESVPATLPAVLIEELAGH